MILKLFNNGLSVVGTREDGATVSYSIEAEEYKQWLVDGGIPEPEFTEVELLANAIAHFEAVTTAYIEGKVKAYNIANGLAFANIDAFPKYAINTASQHHAVANQFIVYADHVWGAVRVYQATLTAIPTDVDFKAVLDGVVF